MGRSRGGDRDWTPIREDYEAGKISIEELCAVHEVTAGPLYWRAHKEGWRLRSQPQTRLRMVDRLFDVLSRQIDAMGGSGGGKGDVAVLGSLVKTFELLTEIENSMRRASEGPAPDPETRVMRMRLAERLERLNRG